MIETLIAAALGILAGIFTGLMPGIHVNLVSAFVVASAGYLLDITSAFNLCVFIVSMAVTHTFLDTIPSIFLGAPDSDKVLSVLPGHRLLLEGKGMEAVMLSVVGAIFGLVFASALIPLLVLLTPSFYDAVKDYIAYILIVAVLMLFIFERKNRFWALFVFLLSGVIGLAVLNIKELNEPLFPLLSGLFGVGMLLVSLNMNMKIKEQEEIGDIKIEKKAVIASGIGGWLASFMPGLGPSQVAIIISGFMKVGERAFLVLVGGLGTVNMALSLVTFYILDKARNGAIVAVSKVIENINLYEFAALIAVCLISAGIAVVITLKTARRFSILITKVDYKKMCLIVIFIVTALVVLISGWIGFVVLAVTTAVGIFTNLKGVSKNNMMGCLLVPVIFYFLGIR